MSFSVWFFYHYPKIAGASRCRGERLGAGIEIGESTDPPRDHQYCSGEVA